MAQDTSHPVDLQAQAAALPDRPGVYLFRDAGGTLLYVGKAASLRKRVSSYFRKGIPLAPRIARLIRRVHAIEVQETASEAEALLLEASLIKRQKPYYNVAFRDDKTYPLLKVTNEPFPRLLVTRRRQSDGAIYFGPYTDPGLMHHAVQFLRRFFPIRTCAAFPKTPCLEYHLGQCLAPCVGAIGERAYQRIVDDLIAFLEGRRDRLLKELTRRMHQAARHQQFEEAARLRDQLEALTSVIVAKEKSLAAGPLEQLQAALKLPQLPKRVEAFDISNIFGACAVGSMVVFVDGRPYKAHYRRFRIETVQGIDDYQMMREVIRRRYSGSLARELPLPDLILIDGGKGQLGAVCDELATLSFAIPVMGLAKRLEEIFLPGSPRPVVLLPTSPVLHLVQHIRDEAHRFAVTYHRRLRAKTVRTSVLHEIPGIGPRRAALLLAHFGSIRRIAKATPEELAAAARMGRSLAERLRTHLARVGEPRPDDAS